jgi:hypothetical protein
VLRHSLDIRHSSFGILPKPAITLATLLLLFTASGSACPWMRTGGEILPVTLPDTATLDQLTAAVNDNTARVQSLLATQATISLPGAPTLPVSLALEPPLRFRLRASIALIGPVVDLGSNDELFWLWIKQSQPPALYYCRHDQFAGSAARRLMPVEPEWIVEALGLVRFDPADLPQGPTPVGSGRVQIRSVRHSSVGELTKITVVDPARAIVLEQDLYDVRGQLVASARTSAHRRDPVTGAILPRHIEIDYPGAQLTMKIDIADLQVNALGPQNAQYWIKPEYAGFPDMNLADPNILAQPGGFAPQPSGFAPQPGPTPLPGAQFGPPSSVPAWQPSAPPTSGYAPPQGSTPATPTGYRSPRFAPYP